MWCGVILQPLSHVIPASAAIVFDGIEHMLIH